VIAGCPSLASTLNTGCTKIATITVGDTVRTTIGPNSCQEADGTNVDFYSLTVSGQANAVIALYAPGLRTYVQVYDPLHTPVVSSNVFQTPDSTASVRVMLAPAAYQIAVRDSLAGTQGAYRLSVTNDTAPAAGCGLIWITPGITTTQTLTTADCTASGSGTTHYYHHYEMVMLFSQSNVFTDTSTAFSPSMTLFASTGSSVNSTLNGTVATIAAFAQSQDYYQLWVGSAAALQTGTYKLTVK
jgi:hypothetical protein